MSEIYEFKMEMRRMIERWKEYSKRIANVSKDLLGDCDVYVFGSVAEDTWTGGSDVDILVISDNLPESNKERGELKAKIEEKAGLPLFHPFEIHLANSKEAEQYWRHIRKFIKIK